MATPAQIANDLEEHGKALKGRGQDILCRSLLRGAETIRELMDQVTVKETAGSVQKIRISQMADESWAIATMWLASELAIEYGEAAEVIREAKGMQPTGPDPVYLRNLVKRFKDLNEVDA